MKITEKPLSIGKLIAIKELKGGNKGVLFLLSNEAGHRLVVKFQNEETVEPLAGTRIMQRAGATTPGIRRATLFDVTAITQAVGTLPHSFLTVVQSYKGAKDRFKNVLLMEFAEGVTLKTMRTDSLDDFLTALQDQTFQQELGRMLAADAFAGNPDRMFAGKIGFTPQQVEGWYHEQNTFIQTDSMGGSHAVGIDNAFKPKIFEKTLPWGRYLGSVGVQWGSVAAAYGQYAAEEAGHLFDKFLATARTSHPAETARINALVGSRALFVQNVALGAGLAMQLLLERGQGWKQQLRSDRATDEMLEEFRLRKRLIRQLAAGVDAQQAWQRAQDTEAYRKWVLMTEHNMNATEAQQLIQRSMNAYKDFKREQRG